MAIKLDIKDYCHNCPDFEPDVDKNQETLYIDDPMSFINREGIVQYNETTIRCKYRGRCMAVKEYLESTIKEEK